MRRAFATFGNNRCDPLWLSCDPKFIVSFLYPRKRVPRSENRCRGKDTRVSRRRRGLSRNIRGAARSRKYALHLLAAFETDFTKLSPARVLVREYTRTPGRKIDLSRGTANFFTRHGIITRRNNWQRFPLVFPVGGIKRSFTSARETWLSCAVFSFEN